VSFPRLPALPAICRREFEERRARPPDAPYLLSADRTVVLAGMLMPAASVSVENTTCFPEKNTAKTVQDTSGTL